MVYSYLISKSSKTLSDAKKEYEKSLDKAYELYYYLLLLPVELTRLQQKINIYPLKKIFSLILSL